MLISQLQVCQEGGQEVGYLKDVCIPQRTTFCVDISIISVSGRWGQEGGYLEDVEGS